MKQAGEELCRVHCEWIMPTINWASAHQRGGLAGNIEKSTFLTTAYEHFPKPFHPVLWFASKRNQSHRLWPWLLNWSRGLRGIPLMFSEIPNNFSVFWRTLDFQVENMSACEMLVLSSTNRLNVPLKSVIEFAPIFRKWSSFLCPRAWRTASGWNSGRLLQTKRIAS